MDDLGGQEDLEFVERDDADAQWSCVGQRLEQSLD
jgi:hypothetical protein